MQSFNLTKNKKIVNEHYALLEPYLRDKIVETTLNKELRKFIDDNLKDIITSEPSNLEKLNKKFKSLPSYKDSLKKKVSKIFNYKYFSTKSNNGSYDAYILTDRLKIRTCLYCNRNYTLTVFNGRLQSQKFTRPELDHFFDKGDNPLLALSIYNLIPSCKTCNSSLKGSKKFNLNNHLHPYVDDVVNFYKYKFIPSSVGAIVGATTNLKLEIEVNSGNAVLDKKINNGKAIFRLEEIMSAHSEELQDLFDIKHRFSERYFEELFKTYGSLGLKYDEVYRIVFGVYYTENDFTKRPFSKLKKDILKELNIIK